MNRVIKFRVWDSAKGKMLTNATDIYLATNENGIFEIEPKKSGLKIMQSTGLLDKNGKEIYEGDIVNWGIEKPDMCVVFWYKEEAMFVYQTIAKKKPFVGAFDKYSLPFEIIGNIYENPELLTPKE